MPIPIDYIASVYESPNLLYFNKSTTTIPSLKNQKIAAIAKDTFAQQEIQTAPAPTESSLGSKTSSYEKPFSKQDEENIGLLFQKLSSMGLLELMVKKKELESMGAKLDSLHPLAVWKYVLNNPKLKSDVDQIKTKSLVWNSLLNEYSKKLELQYQAKNLSPENIEDFLKATNRSTTIKIDKNTDWRDFLKSVL